eukprot:3841791-Pleurochrysis_carterae.AAC.2
MNTTLLENGRYLRNPMWGTDHSQEINEEWGQVFVLQLQHDHSTEWLHAMQRMDAARNGVVRTGQLQQ